MRYYLRSDALIVRGSFRAVSTGVHGGISDVSTLLNISVPIGFTENATKYIERISSRYGFLSPEYGLLTAVPVNNTCIVQYDEITVFATAAVSDRNRTINIIVVSSSPMTDSGLLGALMTVGEVKTKILTQHKIGSACLSTDAAIVAAEKNLGIPVEFAGPLTDIGKKIYMAVSFALNEALVRFDNYLLSNWGVSHGWASGEYTKLSKRHRPSFFVYSRRGGGHWNEWVPENCPYYPCHNFDNQKCTFCYCPLYPCKDSHFSKEIETQRGKVWSCQDCTFIHRPEIESYLQLNPEASMAELKKVMERKKREE